MKWILSSAQRVFHAASVGTDRRRHVWFTSVWSRCSQFLCVQIVLVPSALSLRNLNLVTAQKKALRPTGSEDCPQRDDGSSSKSVNENSVCVCE